MPRRDDLATTPTVDWRAVVNHACTRKVSYTDPADAKRNARRIGDPTLRTYRCPFTRPDERSHWHLGHTPTWPSVLRIAAAIRARAQDQNAA